MHSPFVFDFITSVLNDKKKYPAYASIEALRKELKNDQRIIEVEDFGAGSVTGAQKNRSIASLARYAAKPPKYAQLLYRVVKKYKPASVIELGTSLGLTTAYLASASDNRVLTMEGSAAIAACARQNLSKLHLNNVDIIEGNFDQTLPTLLAGKKKVDFVFIDGNHREEPTIRYFEQLLPLTHNDSILIFDDIHWSEGMEKAWEYIRNHPGVRCSIDLFFIGIVVFRQEFKEKQHFPIRF